MRSLILFFLLCTIAPAVSAADAVIGVSPADVQFKSVLRGGYAERFLTLSTDSAQPYTVELSTQGETASWINLSQKSLNISRDRLGRVRVSVEPPTDTPNGNYTGIVRVNRRTTGPVTPEGHAAGTLHAVIDVVLNIEVIDEEVIACVARDFSIESVEKEDDSIFSVAVENTGNIRIRPRIVLDIWDQDQTLVVKSLSFTGNSTLPTRQETIPFRVPTDDLETGQYWVDASVIECSAAETLTFDVLEPGSLKAQGVLLSIVSRNNPKAGETIPIIASFRNVGEKEVEAQFRGTITEGGSIVQVLESERIAVAMNELTNFTFFFTPTEVKDYVVSGRVFYDKKKTFESSTVIRVIDGGFSFRSVLMTLFYIIIIALVCVLFYKIRHERKRHMGRLGGFA